MSETFPTEDGRGTDSDIVTTGDNSCASATSTPDPSTAAPKASISMKKSQQLIEAYKELEKAEEQVNDTEDQILTIQQQINVLKESLDVVKKSAADAQDAYNAAFQNVKNVELQEPSQWNLMYNNLKKYKEEHGDCLVPHRSNDTDMKKLGRWVANQRVFYRMHCEGKMGHIKPTRIEALNDLGFVWNKNEMLWNQKFQELVKFRDEHGHNCVSQVVDPKIRDQHKALHQWINGQQEEFRKYNNCLGTNITEERIKKLNEVDFDWVNPNSPYSVLRRDALQNDAPNNRRKTKYNESSSTPFKYPPNHVPTEDEIEEKWNEGYKLLLDFYNQNGHCELYKNSVKNGIYNRLRLFVQQQRKEYVKFMESETNEARGTKINNDREGYARRSLLTWERIEKLESIGFAWKNRKGRKRKSTESTTVKPEAKAEVEGEAEAEEDPTGEVNGGLAIVEDLRGSEVLGYHG